MAGNPKTKAVATPEATAGDTKDAQRPEAQPGPGTGDVEDIVARLLVRVREYGSNTQSLDRARTRIRSRFERAQRPA